MQTDLALFCALAAVLGVKHAFDADHLVAVSNLLARARGPQEAIGLSASWAGGHMITAGIVAAVLFFVADSFAAALIARLDVIVPIMLIAMGVIGLLAAGRTIHVHRHSHGAADVQHVHVHTHLRSRKHEHGAMAGIGVAHGLASNDELLVVLLIGLGASSWVQVGLGVAFFSLGVLVGMLVYSLALASTTRVAVERFGFRHAPAALMVVFSILSLVYAGYLLAGGVGINLAPVPNS